MAGSRLFLFSFLVAFVASQGSDPVVQVAQGNLQGSWKMSSNGRTYASFQGVPYARPPIGKYRFREPQSPEPWLGTWDATRSFPMCLQYNKLIPEKCQGSENCLFLNVYTPLLNASARLPVIVFLHAGAFISGSSRDYDATSLMDRDLVLVTLNYRLGPLGFLSTGDESSPGNYGLKDQSLALRWVQNNILVFGGDPKNVTLGGVSAGGASVTFHYMSPLSQGTFVRGIAFSGSALAPWALEVKPLEKARSLATIVGCPTTTTRDIVTCLRNRPAEDIIIAQTKLMGWENAAFSPFVPTVEPAGVWDPFLTQNPYHAAQTGVLQRLPLVITVSAGDGLYPAAFYQADPTILPYLKDHWEQLASIIFMYNDTLPAHLRPAVAAKIKQHYLEGRPVSQETFPQLAQALGDRLFASPAGELARLHARRSSQPVYMYRFAFRGNISLSSAFSMSQNNYGVCHGDDMLYLFKPSLLTTTQDKQMIKAQVDMIYSYATAGVPRYPNGPEWQQLTPGAAEINYLDILSADKMEMKSTSNFGNRIFWDSLGFFENENYENRIIAKLLKNACHHYFGFKSFLCL